MPIILSLCKPFDSEEKSATDLWAAGPEGLFAVNDPSNGNGLTTVPQPQQELYCCGVADDRVLVGGLPHGVAFSRDAGTNWQASWVDGVDAPVLCIAPDPNVAESGVMLAGSAGGGILRTRNRGEHWWVCNFGLQDYTILALAWAPVAPDDIWPRREIVFAGTEEGIYRSPNAGLGLASLSRGRWCLPGNRSRCRFLCHRRCTCWNRRIWPLAIRRWWAHLRSSCRISCAGRCINCQRRWLAPQRRWWIVVIDRWHHLESCPR